MKTRFLFLSVLIAATLPSYAIIRGLAGIVGKTTIAATPAAGGITTSPFWQYFETSPVSQANLDADDHSSVGTWTFSDASSKLTIAAGGETATLSTVDGVADTGTKGLVYNLSGGALARVQYDFSTAKTDLVIGFWYTTGIPASFDYGPQLLSLESNADGNALKIFDRRNAGGNERELAFISSSTVNMRTGIADSTKYWISVRFVKNGTGKIAIYNSAGVQQGTTTDITCYNFNVDFFQLGSQIAFTSQATSVYFDDLVINWTSPSNTIGP